MAAIRQFKKNNVFKSQTKTLKFPKKKLKTADIGQLSVWIARVCVKKSTLQVNEYIKKLLSSHFFWRLPPQLFLWLIEN